MLWNIFALVIDLSNNFGRVIYLRMLYTHCFIQYDYQGATWIHSVSIGCVPKHIMLVLFAGLCRKVADWSIYDAHDLIPDTTLQERFQISHSATSNQPIENREQVQRSKDYKINIYSFLALRAALRSKTKDCLTQKQNNVSEWSDMSTERVDLVQSEHCYHLIECNLYSSWYSWKISRLTLSNNHSLKWMSRNWI
jgi:hypothetical protein